MPCLCRCSYGWLSDALPVFVYHSVPLTRFMHDTEMVAHGVVSLERISLAFAAACLIELTGTYRVGVPSGHFACPCLFERALPCVRLCTRVCESLYVGCAACAVYGLLQQTAKIGT